MTANEWAILQSVALASLLAWASGVRLYLVVFATGLGGYLGYVDLPPGLAVLKHPWVIGSAGLLLAMWDSVHTFIRIPAGALLAAGATGDTLSALTVAAGLLGGTITAGTHFTKAGGRAILNTSPEPFSNWAASFAEDAIVLGAIWLAFKYPIAFLVLLAIFIVFMIWFIPKVWRAVAALVRRVRPRPQAAAS
jgi:hypothetical protein